MSLEPLCFDVLTDEENTVRAIDAMVNQFGLFCMVRAKKYRSHKGDVGKIAPNLLDRDFAAKRPYEKWATDVTEFNLFGKKLYLSTILDLNNSEFISYTISPHPRLSLVMNMPNNAVERLPGKHAIILHSDQGWHYQMKTYQRVLEVNHIQQSMSHCLDNAVGREENGAQPIIQSLIK